MRKMARVLLAALVVLGMLAFVAAGGAEGGSEKGGAKVIKFLHRYPEEPQNGYINRMIAEFEKAHPGVKFEVQSAHYSAYTEKVKTSLRSDSPPDVYFAYAGEFMNNFVREGLVYDITDAFNRDTAWKDSQVASVIAPYYYKDRLYGLPFRVDAKAFFYSKAIFAKYNLEAPKTWDDLVRICETLKKNGVTPIAFGNQDAWPSAHYIGELNQKVVDNPVRVRDLDPALGEFTDPGYVEALKYFMILMGYANANPNGTTHEIARQNFINGKAAMVYLETIEIPSVEKAAPAGFQYGIFGFPNIPSGKGAKGFVTGAPEGFVVLKNTKFPQEAVAFLKFITGPEVGKGLVKEVGWFNASKGIIDASYPNPGIREAYQMLTTATGLTNWLDVDLNAELASKYLADVQRLINKEISPEQVMKDIQDLAAEVRKNAK